MLCRQLLQKWVVKKNTRWLAAYFRLLNQLQVTIFASYIKQDYFEYQTQYEKQSITKAKALFLFLKRIRSRAKNRNDWRYIHCCERIYESLCALELLKHRAIDHATFEICRHEMQQVSSGLSLLLQGKNKMEARVLLGEAISAFEAVFQSTIQFITADPIVFLVFIRDIKTLKNEINHAMGLI